MNTKRRSLGAALEMSDDKMAFIKGGVPPIVDAVETPVPKVPLVEPAESLELNAETSSAWAVPTTVVFLDAQVTASEHGLNRIAYCNLNAVLA